MPTVSPELSLVAAGLMLAGGIGLEGLKALYSKKKEDEGIMPISQAQVLSETLAKLEHLAKLLEDVPKQLYGVTMGVDSIQATMVRQTEILNGINLTNALMAETLKGLMLDMRDVREKHNR